ncbi:MAG TPA: hypothetical protein PK228_11505, partial [Saprospiraceae bacterium]|nr:hypothetical protein [Saprospiraceae bacterium]
MKHLQLRRGRGAAAQRQDGRQRISHGIYGLENEFACILPDVFIFRRQTFQVLKTWKVSFQKMPCRVICAANLHR